MLRAAGLVKAYRAPSGARIPVLQGIDLRVDGGQFVAITGASGSGKSTLLNLLGLLESPEAGDVWYAAERVTALSRRAQSAARGQYVGFMFQSFLLLPSLTALENVLLAGRYVGRRGRAARERARQLLDQVGLGARAEHYPAELSGGEQQRVAFCRAVFNDPPLLLADEPTGNLDDPNAAVILAALRARADRGAAVVLVTHRVDVVTAADRAWHLAAGQLSEETAAGRQAQAATRAGGGAEDRA